MEAATLYEVTEDGRVFSMTGWRGSGRRELVQILNDDGYPTVRLTINGRRRRFCVHVLVATRFLGAKPYPGAEVRHPDGNKTNSTRVNLAWGSRAENAHDRKAHGTERSRENGRASAHKIRGERNSGAKLTEAGVRDIRSSSGPLKPLAQRYGVDISLISKIRRGRGWNHVR